MRSIVPCREALLGEGSTKEGELTACFCLTWTSLCLYVPSSSCDPVESYSAPSKGEIQRRHCSWKRTGALYSARRAWGLGFIPWDVATRQKASGVVALWCSYICFGTLARLSEAASWEPPRDKQTAKEKEGWVTRRGRCLPQATRAGLSGRGAS